LQTPPAKTSWRACGRSLHPASHRHRYCRSPRSDRLTSYIPSRPAFLVSQQRRRMAMAAGRGLLALFSVVVVAGLTSAANGPFLSGTTCLLRCFLLSVSLFGFVADGDGLVACLVLFALHEQIASSSRAPDLQGGAYCRPRTVRFIFCFLL
jgi:hypothetical protein